MVLGPLPLCDLHSSPDSGPELLQSLVHVRNQVKSAPDFALRPAPQFQIALVETRERSV